MLMGFLLLGSVIDKKKNQSLCIGDLEQYFQCRRIQHELIKSALLLQGL